LIAAQVSVQLGMERFSAKVVDWSDEGLGLELRRLLTVGTRVRVKGQIPSGSGHRQIDVGAVVRWSCSAPTPNTFKCGLLLDRVVQSRSEDPDYYEALQLSPNADPDTIHRVFRLLAQRFHPDNQQTGDEAWFKVLARAYEVLSDPVKRAEYDARRPADQQQRWKLFESSEAAKGIEAERRKRQGLLSLLYARRANDPRDPSLSLIEMEQVLGCPREHLDFALWFLRENSWVIRYDSGKYAITAKGVEKAEVTGAYPAAETRIREDRLLAAS
jgi:hypothetical protein